MTRSPVFLLIAGLFLAVLVPDVATATHWIPVTEVSVSPLQTKAGRDVNFQVTVTNNGDETLTVCHVDILFDWNDETRRISSGSEDIPGGGGNGTWTSTESIPSNVPVGSHSYIVTVTGRASLPELLDCRPNDWTGTIDIVPNLLPTVSFEFNPPNPFANTTVYFFGQSSDPDGTITRWNWNFGDGDFAEGRDEMHTFESSGAFPVVLIVTDDDGATNSTSRTVEVVANARPVAAFSYSPTNPRVNTTVQFSDMSSDSDGTIVDWRWELGDGTISSSRDPTHRYTSPAIRSIRLNVTDNLGSTSSFLQQIQIMGNLAPVSDFSFSPEEVTTNTVIHFVDRSSDDGSVVAWFWEFGDGANSTERSPTHRYVEAGEYRVSLRVTDNEGSSDTRTLTILIAVPPAGGGDTTASGIGLLEWALVAFGVAAIATIVSFVVKNKLRPRRRWGQAHTQTPATEPKSWRQQTTAKSWRQPTDSKSRWRQR